MRPLRWLVLLSLRLFVLPFARVVLRSSLRWMVPLAIPFVLLPFVLSARFGH